jgi:type I restriction enzyme R subunit
MGDAGYSDAEAAAIKAEISHYAAVRDEVKLGAGEDIDFKQYEAGMRFLLDTYIQADASETVADFQDTGLIELIVQMGAGAIDKLPEGIKRDPAAVAETITNNMRKVIIDERAMNPKYYEKMSQLRDTLIEEKRRGAIDYKEYLEKLVAQAQQLGKQESDTVYPDWIDNGATRALYDFGFPDEALVLGVDEAIRNTKPDRWIGNAIKEKKVRRALINVLPADYERVDELMALVKARDEYR